MEDIYKLPEIIEPRPDELKLWLSKQIPYFLNKNDIKINQEQSEEIYYIIAVHVYNLMYNVIGISAIMTKLENPKKLVLKPKYLEFLLSYVQQKCYPELNNKTQSGGSYHIDSEYFGKNSGSYTSNAGADLLPVKFGLGGHVRPAINMNGGQIVSHEIDLDEVTKTIFANSERKNLFPDNEIVKLLDEYGISVKNNSLKILKKILKMHMNCLLIDLYKETPLNIKKINKVFNLKRHSIFN